MCVGGEYGEGEYHFGAVAWELFCWGRFGAVSCYCFNVWAAGVVDLVFDFGGFGVLRTRNVGLTS